MLWPSSFPSTHAIHSQYILQCRIASEQAGIFTLEEMLSSVTNVMFAQSWLSCFQYHLIYFLKYHLIYVHY